MLMFSFYICTSFVRMDFGKPKCAHTPEAGVEHSTKDRVRLHWCCFFFFSLSHRIYSGPVQGPVRCSGRASYYIAGPMQFIYSPLAAAPIISRCQQPLTKVKRRRRRWANDRTRANGGRSAIIIPLHYYHDGLFVGLVLLYCNGGIIT